MDSCRVLLVALRRFRFMVVPSRRNFSRQVEHYCGSRYPHSKSEGERP